MVVKGLGMMAQGRISSLCYMDTCLLAYPPHSHRQYSVPISKKGKD